MSEKFSWQSRWRRVFQGDGLSGDGAGWGCVAPLQKFLYPGESGPQQGVPWVGQEG